MPRTLIIEAGFARLSPDFFAGITPNWREKIIQALECEKIEFLRIKHWCSHYRIGFGIEGFIETQSEITKEIRGPKTTVALDYNNIPMPAGIGFAAAQGVDFSDLIVKEIDGEKFLVALKTVQINSTENIANKLKDIFFDSFTFSVPSWSSKSRFPQPPLYFLALIDNQVCNIELEDCKARNLTAISNGVGVTWHEIDDARFYTQIMSGLGVIFDLAERRKTLETRIRSILPEGAILRSEGKHISQLCCFEESLQPILLKFDESYLEMPGLLIHKFINQNFSYLACENSREELLPLAIAISDKKTPKLSEIKLRTFELNNSLLTLRNIWQNETKEVLSRLTTLLQVDEKNSMFFPVHDDILNRCSLFLISKLGLQKLSGEINTIIAIIREAEKSRVECVFPAAGCLALLNYKEKPEQLKDAYHAIEEICNYYLGRITVPSLVVAQVVSLALRLRDFAAISNSKLDTPAIVCSLLKASNFRLDIFQVLSELFPEISLNRKAWLEYLITDTSRDGQIFEHEIFLNCYELDPASYYEAARSWKEFDLAEITAIYARLKSKIEGTTAVLEKADTDCHIEKEIFDSLIEIDESLGINYLKIFQLFRDHRVNIEACLLNLPPILDDTDIGQASRILLLQLLAKQLERLPFITKEKVSAKNKIE